MKLRENPVSIISDNCFAGFVYHRLDLRFTSPTINMWFHLNDFIYMVKDLRQSMSQEIVFDHYGWDSNRASRYPIMNIPSIHRGIKIHSNHTDSYSYAKEKWDERRKLINYDNILIVMRVHNSEELSLFEEIPYRKKCFTNFLTDCEDAIYLPSEVLQRELWQVENMIAKGYYPIINLVNLLAGEMDFITAKFS